MIADLRRRGEDPDAYFVLVRTVADPDLRLFDLYHASGLRPDRRLAVNASGEDMTLTYDRRLGTVTNRRVWQ